MRAWLAGEGELHHGVSGKNGVVVEGGFEATSAVRRQQTLHILAFVGLLEVNGQSVGVVLLLGE